jgi:predicted TIM-barrel enzyme
VALASGVSHHNIHEFSGLVDAFIVASSLNRESDFLNFDTKKVKTMSTILRELNS